MTGACDETLYWLESEGGRVAIGPASVLVGRNPDCDLVIPDPRVSRHHALFRLTDDGVEVLPVGRQPLEVNGEAKAAATALRAGDRVECLGRTFTIVETSPSRPPDADVFWAVESGPGALFRVTQSPFRIGGSVDDHLIFPGWPPAVLLLHRVGNGLSLEALREGVTCRSPLAPGECVHLDAGARFAFGAQSLRVVALPRDPTKVTEGSTRDDLPTAAELRFMPKGGRLTLTFGARTFSVYLPDRRCDLVACLLQPPPPFAPGDAVPDEALIERVWPQRDQGRIELNTLVFRARKDLIKAEIDGAALIAREGGGVCLRLAPGATVRVGGP